MFQLALYQPEIPQNTGTLIRLSACLGFPLHVIEPLGFIWDDRRLKRSMMDYYTQADIHRHSSYEAFCATTQTARKILVDTQGECPYDEFIFQESDILLMGRESCGVPTDVFNRCAEKIYIPMQSKLRSLNLAIASSIVIGEAFRQQRLRHKTV